MTNKFIAQVAKYFDIKIDPTGLAIFRFLYFLVLLAEIAQIFYFRQLIFNSDPSLSIPPSIITSALLIWLGVTVLLIIGLFTRIASIINYAFTLIAFSSTPLSSLYSYHYDYVLLITNFLIIFLPASNSFSLDNLLRKFNHSKLISSPTQPQKISLANHYILLIACVGFVYFDSIFHKLGSPLWLQGMGMWLPASLPQTTWMDLTPLLNNKFLCLSLGYITIIFEAAFLFLIFIQRMHPLILIVGASLHFGILLAFPIPFFAIGMLTFYILLLPPGFWTLIKNIFQFITPLLNFYYDEACPICQRTKILINHFDIFKAIQFKGIQTYASKIPELSAIEKEHLLKDIHSTDRKGNIFWGLDTYIQVFKKMLYLYPLGFILKLPGFNFIGKITYARISKNRHQIICDEKICGSEQAPPAPDITSQSSLLTQFTQKYKLFLATLIVSILLFMQLAATYQSPIFYSARNLLDHYSIGQYFNSATRAIGIASKILFGITPHGVFMDSHFTGFNHIVALTIPSSTGETLWLPVAKENGQTSPLSSGRIWVSWMFRANSPQFDLTKLKKGIRDHSAFWANKFNIDLADANFKIIVKKVDIPAAWEKNFLRKQLSKPWITAGNASWKNHQFTLDIVDLETL